MNRRFLSAWRALSFVLVVCGCGEGFGRPIVDKDPLDPLRYVMCKNTAIGCEAVPSHVPLTPPAPPIFRLGDCAPTPQPACSALASSASALNACQLDITLGNDWESSPRQLTCMAATFTYTAQTTSARMLNLRGRQLELSFVASEPSTIELAGANLTSTRIDLRGPITLRFTQESDLEDVQVVQTVGSGASVEIAESTTSNVSVVGLRGLVQVQRSNLHGTQLFADQVELAASVLTDVGIVSQQLFGVELQGKRVALEFDTGNVSGATLQGLKVQRCGSALFANSGITEAVLGPCTENLRIDRGTVSKSVAVGPLESHIVIWTEDTFGAGVRTRLESWTDSLSYSRFCAGMERFTVSRRSAMICNICDALGAAAEQLICEVPSDENMQDEPEDLTVPDGGSYGVVVGEWFGPRNPECLALELPITCDPLPVDENPF